MLYELSHKYGFTDNFPESSLPNRLEEIKEVIRREIRKELKVINKFKINTFSVFTKVLSLILQIKEGAEKLREVATDRKSISDVQTIVKKSNNKITELKSELHELESQILLTQGNSISNGQGKFLYLISKTTRLSFRLFLGYKNFSTRYSGCLSNGKI